MSVLLLLGGPAGAGKSTLARAWCSTRPFAVHIELDAIRALIIAGAADPQELGELQEQQYVLAANGSIALARVFLSAHYDVVVDDVFVPDTFATTWQPLLANTDWRLVIVLPALDEVLRRSHGREKRVREEHSRAQHEASQAWPPGQRIDTTSLTIEESVELLHVTIGTLPSSSQ